MAGSSWRDSEPEPFEALHHGIVDGARVRGFDRFVENAADGCDCPIALFSLRIEDGHRVISAFGMDPETIPEDVIPREGAPGADGLLKIPDATADPRLAEHPLVVGEPHIRFLACVPVTGLDGRHLGTVSVMDLQPRTLDKARCALLQALSREAAVVLELERRQRECQREVLPRIAGDAARVGGWYWERGSNEVIWSDLTCDIHECPRGTRVTLEEGIGYYVADDRPRIRRAVERCLRDGTPFDEELRIITATGRRLWVRSIGEAVRDPQGEIVSLQGAFQDIDRRRTAEEHARALSDRMRHTLEQISDALFTLDREYRFTFINDEATRILGRRRDALLGEVIWECCGKGDDGPFFRGYRRSMENRESVVVEDYHPTLRAWLEVRTYPTDEGLAVYFRDVSEQRRAREQIHLLESSVNQLNDMLLITDASPLGRPGPRIVYVNEAVVRQTGYARSELIGETPRIFQGEGTDRDELARLRAALEAGEPVQASLVNYHRNGTAYWVELNINPLTDARGTVTHFVAVQRNIDERVAAERMLRESEERFRNVARATADAVWDWDLATDGVWWNEGLYNLFGYRREDLPPDSRSWSEHIHPDDKASVLADIHRVIEGTGIYWEHEYRFLCRDGRTAQVLDRGFVIRDAEGKAIRMVGGMTDVTEQREFQARVAEQAALLEQARDAIIVQDMHHRVTFWNGAAERIYGWRRDQALGADLGGLIGEDAEKYRQATAELLRRGKWAGRIEQRRCDNTPITVEAHWSLVTDEAGNPEAIFAINSDITERLALEGQLQRAQRLEAIGQLTGGVAHDFNNLLTVILGNADLLTRMLADQDRPRQLAELVLTTAERAAELTNRLLTFARRQPLQPEPTDINALVGGMEDLLRRTLGGNIELRLLCAAALPPAEIDPGQLESALLNLCLNARDAMPAGGRLTVETDTIVLDADYAAQRSEVVPGEYVLVAVSDTGEGIPEGRLENVFDPFYTTKAEGKGTGLGLSMVYGFAKQSGGHVNIYSEPGQGTTVRLYLPRSEAGSVVTRLRPEREEIPRGSETVLVVEDDPMVRQHAQTRLADLGYRVLSAPDGEAALGMLQGDTEIDLLFTDVVMSGGMNGRELATAATRFRPSLRVLYTSGYTENAIVHHGRLDPGVHLLQKPYRHAEMAAKVREVLDESR
ncbi:PAS domain S-box protein [Arhodomonas sp. SL1]|uniref:PAS domain S-box protein n=1 Tax=Arhodomonas sp. SL1 TaxID=3425691 RepID=UPI003F883655